VESLLVEAEVSSLQTRIPVRRSHHFLIQPLDLAQIFRRVSDAVFLGVDVESLLGEAEVSKLEYRFERAITFDPTVGSRSNF